jgi:N-acetylglutamate synthase-like GNAT family acetyltransferase
MASQNNLNPGSTAITIRPAEHADLPVMAELIQPFVDAGQLLPRTMDELEELLGSYFVAALPDGTVVGCAVLEIYSKKLAEIRSLAVSPDAQGMGIGRLLVRACVERAQQRDILEVMAITQSEDFFKACGFDFTLPGQKKALFYQTHHD